MKKINVLALAAIVMLGVASCDSRKSVSLKAGDIDTLSYLIGARYGYGLTMDLKNLPLEKGNVDAMIAGFLTAASGDSVYLGKFELPDIEAFIQTYFQGVTVRMNEESQKEGNDFLAENKTKSGVITTESGLQYKVTTEGTGAKPLLTDTVLVHYTGKYLDGTVFDSSLQNPEPLKFALTDVIPGWSEGLMLMPTGSKYTLWIPSEIAYGPNPQNGIKPSSTLEFEVELLDIIKPK